MEVAGAGTKRVFTGEFIRRGEAFLVGRDITEKGLVEKDWKLSGVCDEPSHIYAGVSSHPVLCTRGMNLLKPCILDDGCEESDIKVELG